MAHDNPFDPISDDFTASGSVSGVISNRALEPLGEAGVRLVSLNEDAAFSVRSVTDIDGAYSFKAVPEGLYTLTVEKAGYAPVNDSTLISASEPVAINLTLNGLPALDEAFVRTAHISRVWPPPTDFTLLEASVRANDSDGLPDLDRVWLEIPAIDFVDTLRVTEIPGIYKDDLSQTDLGIASMHDLVGKPMVFHAQDRPGATMTSESLTITRVISQTPVVNAPQAGAVLTDPQPMLTWVCQPIPFSFWYRLDIVRLDDVVRNTVFSQDSLSPVDVCDANREGRFQVDAPLAIGSYFWTVSIVDEFGNRSRSREAGFVIN